MNDFGPILTLLYLLSHVTVLVSESPIITHWHWLSQINKQVPGRGFTQGLAYSQIAHGNLYSATFKRLTI